MLPFARALFLLASTTALASAGRYYESFDSFAVGASDLSPAGTLYSNQLGTTTKILDQDRKELQLIGWAIPGTNSAFILPNLDVGRGVGAFSAKWNSQIYSNTGSFMADGLSFNFGQLGQILPNNFFNGAIANEQGFGTGLSFGISTYPDAPAGYYIRVNGQVVPGGFVSKPNNEWGALNTARHHFEVDWHLQYGLSVRVDGVPIFTNLPVPGFVPGSGDLFGFGARTGGSTQETRLDNIAIVTGGVLVPAAMTNAYLQSGAQSQNPERAFDGNPATQWVGAASGNYVGNTFAQDQAIQLYTVTSGPGSVSNAPLSWKFETGNTTDPWPVVGTETGQRFFGPWETRAFGIASPIANRKFRLNVLANAGGTTTAIGELTPWILIPAPYVMQVNNTDDSGAGSLRSAVVVASSIDGPTRILFRPDMAGATIPVGAEFNIVASANIDIDASAVKNVTLDGGGSGRIFKNAGSLKLSHLTLKNGNSTDGGAINGGPGATTQLAHCTFSGNVATRGAGAGGAVRQVGTLLADSCTFVGNSAAGGGAVHVEGTATFSKCTFTGNDSPTFGGAIHSFASTISLFRCTVAGNTSDTGGGGIDLENSNLTIEDSIVHSNSAADAPIASDISFYSSGTTAAYVRLGKNIVGAVIGANTATGPAPITTDPRLAPLGDYGGVTKTMALRSGSPAVNAGTGTLAATDQRGFPRIGAQDIGAYESGTLTNYGSWAFETMSFSIPASQLLPNADYDGDGSSNVLEWLTGNDLANAASRFKMTTTGVAGGNFNFQFPSVAGARYQVQISENCVTWTNIGDPYTGDGNPIALAYGPVNTPKLFVRVNVFK